MYSIEKQIVGIFTNRHTSLQITTNHLVNCAVYFSKDTLKSLWLNKWALHKEMHVQAILILNS